MPQARRGLNCRLRTPPGDGLSAAVQAAVQAHFHGEPETVPPPPPNAAGTVWVNGNWRLTFTFEGTDAVLLDYQDHH